MAQIVIQRSPIADFLDELPSLILQYKQMEYAQEERAIERQLKSELLEKGYEIEAGKSMYNENMKIYSAAEQSLQLLETEYHKAVGDVSSLGELYKAAGNEVVRDVYEGEATDYSARADWAYDNAQQIKGQIETLQGSLYGDIKRAENIMAGGAGFRGGVSAEEWDPADLGIVAYELQYGEASPTVQSLFKNNLGAVTESLTRLRKTEQTFGLTEQKIQYYESKTQAEKVQSENDKAELMFGTLSNSSKKTSEMQNLQALQIAEANYDVNTDAATRAANEQGQFAIYKAIGGEFSKLIGRDVKPEDYPEITEEYIEMQNLGSGDAASLMGQTAYGNWSAFKGYVDDAAREYVAAIQANDTEKVRILNELAQKYFGMPPGVSLTQFAADVGDQYSKTLLATFGQNDLITAPSDTTITDTTNIINPDDEWESLLED
jgi:hypothetical protein